MVNLKRLPIASWCLFDFANSSYSAVISAVVFPVYYVSVIVGNQGGQGDLWWGRAISVSMAFVAVTSPFLGGMADYGGMRKGLLALYTGLCILCVGSMSLLAPGMAVAGFVLVVLANIGMEGGLVFYNSFLPDIAPTGVRGRVSAWGFAVGYAGSICSLLIVLPLVKSGSFGASWIAVALFFLVFSVPAFVFLPADRRSGTGIFEAAARGAGQTFSTLRDIFSARDVRLFLAAYLLYEDGVNTVIVFSSIFAATTLHFTSGELVLLYLVVQVTALAGAFAMAVPIDRWGARKVVALSLVLWVCVTVGAYFIYSKALFWGLASVAGLGLGTVQAASRALYAGYIPSGREGEYFGVYSLVGKSSAVAGPLVFGQISSAFGSQRPAILAIAFFFAGGLLLLRLVQARPAPADGI